MSSDRLSLTEQITQLYSKLQDLHQAHTSPNQASVDQLSNLKQQIDLLHLDLQQSESDKVRHLTANADEKALLQ